MHVERERECMGGLVAPVPVVEIPRDDEGRFGGHPTLDALPQLFNLNVAAARREREVHANAVQCLRPAGDRNFTMKQSAPLEAVAGYVLIVPARYRIARKDGV